MKKRGGGLEEVFLWLDMNDTSNQFKYTRYLTSNKMKLGSHKKLWVYEVINLQVGAIIVNVWGF